MKVFLAVFFLIPLFTMPAFAQEMGFYENELYEFSFDVPRDWRYLENVETSDGSIAQVMIWPEGFNPMSDIDTPHIVVGFENIPESKVSRLNGQALEKYLTEEIRSEKFASAKIISIDVESTSWGWIVSTEFIFSQSFGFSVVGQYHTEQKAFIFKDREMYTLAYFATEDYFNTYYPVYEIAKESLVIRGVVVPEFHEIAIMVLGSGIIMIIAISKKFKILNS